MELGNTYKGIYQRLIILSFVVLAISSILIPGRSWADNYSVLYTYNNSGSMRGQISQVSSDTTEPEAAAKGHDWNWT